MPYEIDMQNNRKKIMIVDDDAGILDALQLLLEDQGYDIQVYSDGHMAMQIAKDLPDLILLDIWMSGVNGKDVCLHLKQQRKTTHIPIIMISANRDTQQIALEAGADDFLNKPFEMDDLISKIQRFVA